MGVIPSLCGCFNGLQYPWGPLFHQETIGFQHFYRVHIGTSRPQPLRVIALTACATALVSSPYRCESCRARSCAFGDSQTGVRSLRWSNLRSLTALQPCQRVSPSCAYCSKVTYV